MDYKAIAKWAVSERTGASSKCMAAHFMGLENDGSYPHDAGDFGRCECLLVAVPELRLRLHEMAEVSAYWAALAAKWDDIRTAPEPEKYKIMKAILKPIQDADRNHISLGNGVSISFR